MIRISVSIAYEQNRPSGVASAPIAHIGFLEKIALKILCTKFFSDKSCYKSQYATFGPQSFLIEPWVWPLP